MVTNEGMGATRRRPIGVWIVSACHLVILSLGVLSFALMQSGALEIPSEQRRYFQSFTVVDWLYALSVPFLTWTAVVCLFLLRRAALYLFYANLVVNFASAGVNMMRPEFSWATTGSNLVSFLCGLGISVAVILYVRSLAKSGVLT